MVGFGQGVEKMGGKTAGAITFEMFAVSEPASPFSLLLSLRKGRRALEAPSERILFGSLFLRRQRSLVSKVSCYLRNVLFRDRHKLSSRGRHPENGRLGYANQRLLWRRTYAHVHTICFPLQAIPLVTWRMGSPPYGCTARMGQLQNPALLTLLHGKRSGSELTFDTGNGRNGVNS